MGKWFLFSMYLLFAADCFAQANEYLIRMNEVTSAGDTALCEEDPLQICARALCGSAAEVPDYSVYNPSRENRDIPVPEDLRRRVVNLANKSFEKNRQAVAVLRNADMGLFNLLDDLQWGDKAKSFFGPHVKIEVDSSLPMDQRISFTLQPPEDATDSFKRSLEAYAQSYVSHMRTSPAFGMEEGLYTKEEGVALLQEKWNEFLPKYTQLMTAGTVDLSYINGRFQSLSSFMQNPASASIDSLTSSFSAFRSLEGQFLHISRGEPAGSIYPEAYASSGLCTTEACRSDIRTNLIGDLNSKLNRYEAMLNAPNARSGLVDKCLEQIQEYVNVDSGEMELIAQLPIEVEKIISESMKRSSQHSRDAFRRYTQEKLRVSVSGSFTDYLISDERDIDAPVLPSEHLFTLNQVLESQDLNVDLRICRSRQYNFSAGNVNRDAVLPGDGNNPDEMGLSQFSCSHQEFGSQILSHELGHVLKNAMTRGQLSSTSVTSFGEMRTCLTENNPSVYGPSYQSPFPNDRMYTEEDSADLISFTANKSNRLFACSFLKRSEDGSQYASLTLANPYNDTHSSPFKRLLNEAFIKGNELPQTCQKVVRDNPDLIRLRRCL